MFRYKASIRFAKDFVIDLKPYYKTSSDSVTCLSSHLYEKDSTVDLFFSGRYNKYTREEMQYEIKHSPIHLHYSEDITVSIDQEYIADIELYEVLLN